VGILGLVQGLPVGPAFTLVTAEDRMSAL
jgi:hypothetical protein